MGAEGAKVGLRWFAVAFACAQTATYYTDFPTGVEPVAWIANAAFAVAVVGLTVAWAWQRRRPFTREGRGTLGLVGLMVDGSFAAALCWIYAFDPTTAIFVTMYVVAVEAAWRYALRGAVVTMLVLGASYAARDAWATDHYGIDMVAASITFRIGIGMLIAVVAGLMAERARTEHARLEHALAAEREAAKALRSLDELRSTFLSAVSHELRTPLTSIMGFSLTLRDRTKVDDDQVAMLDHVVEQAARLERLLEDLLEIERLGRGVVGLHRERADVGALVTGLALAHARASGRRLRIDAPPTDGWVDCGKFERVVDNLLANAIKYSPDTTEVRVVVRRERSGVLVCVDDDGPGVPESMRDSIFAPFERGALTSQAQPGTGIGLSLVDRLARLHGGRAWVEDGAPHVDAAGQPRHDGQPGRDAKPHHDGQPHRDVQRSGRGSGHGASFRVWIPDDREGASAR